MLLCALQQHVLKRMLFCMSEKPKRPGRTHEAHLKLIALLLYIAGQKQKSLDSAEQLFSRLMRPGEG
jgi:hypothetical protein